MDETLKTIPDEIPSEGGNEAGAEPGAAPGAEAEAAAPVSTGPEKQWYIIHSYSGFENRVKESLLNPSRPSGFRNSSARS